MTSLSSQNIPSVLFLDRPFAAGMVHLWLREYFFDKGFNLLGGEMPPWKEDTLPTEGADVEEDYLNELDWDEVIRHTMARLTGRYDCKVETSQQKSTIINCFKSYAKNMESEFLSNNVKVAVIFGNYRLETKLAAYFCGKYQAQLICIEGFFLQNYFYLEAGSTQIANHHAFVQKWPYIRNLKVTDEQLKILDRLMRDRENHGLLNDYIVMPTASQTLSEPLQKIADCKGKVGLILGQLPYDAVIVNDLLAFPEQIDFLRFVIKQFLAQCSGDDLIVCRLHPLEARYGDHTTKQLQQIFAAHSQVILLSGDDCNTYQLMALVDFGIVANSQSGLEMIYRDKPVLVCGNPYYAVEQFCLQATDEETITVQLTKLLAGWHPLEKHLFVAKKYLCGLIFHHLCPRNKADVWHKLEQFSAIHTLQNKYTAVLANENKQAGLVMMPNAQIGRVKLHIPADVFSDQTILVIGAGSFSQHLVTFDYANLTFCSDLPADCQQSIGLNSVHLLNESLIVGHQLIFICWPVDKCHQWLADLQTKDTVDKIFYRIEKVQNVDLCEFKFKLLDLTS